MSKATVPPSPSAVSTLISTSGAKSAAESLAITVLHNLQYQHNWTDLRLHLIQDTNAGSTGGRVADDAGTTLIDLDGLDFNHSNSSSRTPSPSRSASSSGSTTPTLDGMPTLPPPALHAARTIPILSGLPPRHSYIHPDLQTHLLKNNIKDTDLQIQREYVLPLALGEKWTLSQFCSAFASLPSREAVRVIQSSSQPGFNSRHPSGNGPSSANSSALAERTANNSPSRANGSARPTAHRNVYEHQDQKRVILGMRAAEGMGGDGTIVYYIMQEGEVKPRQNG